MRESADRSSAAGRSAWLLLSAALLLPACAPVAPRSDAASAAPAVDRGAAATAALHALFEAEWQRALKNYPEYASYLGDGRYNDRWTDQSLPAIEARQREDLAALQRLEAIDRAALPAGAQLDYDLFRLQAQRGIELYAFKPHLMPINQLGGVQTSNDMAEVLSFKTAKDYRDWLARLQALPASIDQNIALMRQGLVEKRSVPRVVMQRVPAQIDKQIVRDAAKSPFYVPFATMPAGIAPAEQAELRRAAEAAIREQVVPAYARLKDFIVRDYLPACRAEVGASALPDGSRYYDVLAQQSTTTTLTAEEIHVIGLREVARIQAEMEAVRKQSGFRGDMKAFIRYLRSDPRFFYRDGQALLTGYRDIAKRIDGELPKLFGKLPRQPYGVRPVPPVSAPDQTTAYYQQGAPDGSRAGFFYANLYKPETRAKWEMEALTAHEAMPGHHLQIALQQELGELPDFRRQASYTAFVEGWGLYSESLGGELGLYTDPASRFGQLTYEMWRAVRLVVDTGMHAKGWSRDQAIAYFMALAPKSRDDITNEIDRYIVWPGQALAYKIGELKIKELRARAEAKLGARFDIRAFHDRVLGRGAVPLNLLEQDIDRWIAERLAAPPSAGP